MNGSSQEKAGKPPSDLERLDGFFKGASELLVVTHNNPDPDALASAQALSHLAKVRYGVHASLAFRGNITRAENRAMIRLLHIRLKQFNRVRLEKYGRIALVDGQPLAGNTPDMAYDLVIDHHPLRKDTQGGMVVIRPEIGVTATILVNWLREASVEIPVNLATALAYAISSETQNLGREANRMDVEAYLHVYTRANMRKLAQILHPNLPREYFQVLDRALHRTHIFRNMLCSHLEDIPSVEIVSEMADFLLRMERISWVLCTGRFKDQLVLSVRTKNPKAKAGNLVKRLVRDSRTVGGHDMTAGGYIDIRNLGKDEIEALEGDLLKKFVRVRGFKEAAWKFLVSNPTAAEPVEGSS